MAVERPGPSINLSVDRMAPVSAPPSVAGQSPPRSGEGKDKPRRRPPPPEETSGRLAGEQPEEERREKERREKEQREKDGDPPPHRIDSLA